MKNKIVMFFGHVLLAIIVGFLLMKSIGLLISNIAQQKEITLKKAQVLKNTINAPNYLSSQGIKSLTPEVLLNYDKKFGTALSSKVSFPTPPPIYKQETIIETNPKTIAHYDKVHGTNLSSKILMQPSDHNMLNKVILAISPNIIFSYDKKYGTNLAEKIYTPTSSHPTITISQPAKQDEISITALQEPIRQSEIELQATENSGIWPNLSSSSITLPSVLIWVFGVFLTNLINKISEDCYPAIKQIMCLFLFPIVWLAKKMWRMISSHK